MTYVRKSLSRSTEFGKPHFTKRPRYWIIRYAISIILVINILNTVRRSIISANERSRIQYGFKSSKSNSLADSEKLQVIEREFLHAWTGYKDHSWMSDSLMPLSGGRQEQFCGWSATLIDTLDTLYIMDLKEEFDIAVNATMTIDFAGNAENCQVNIFESTIRYLGGMLAAYDLSKDQRLLAKVTELGDLLLLAFNSKNGMPCNYCDLSKAKRNETIIPDSNVALANMASFYLEFGRLWQVTGNKRYFDILVFLTETFQHAQNQSSVPGLWPEQLDATSINGMDTKFVTLSTRYSLGALSDSAYEYLVKTHLLLGGIMNQYSQMWTAAALQIKQLLLFRAHIPQWNETNALFSGIGTKSFDDDMLVLEPRTEHLACFAGGMFALSSRMFNKPEDLEIAKALTNGCVWAYENSPLGIMPETITLFPCLNSTSSQCSWDQLAWDMARDQESNYPPGIVHSIDMHYGLRPEAIESVFVLYRITGDQKWRDIGWRMFNKIIEHTRTPYGHAALRSVMDMTAQFKYDGNKRVLKEAATQMDQMESFWLAETLKYFYLLFSDPSLISLDEFVLNTEAHPLRLTPGIRGFP